MLQCVAVVARTQTRARSLRVLCNSRHISLQCVEFQDKKTQSFPSSILRPLRARNCCGRFETLCACVHGGLRIHARGCEKILFVAPTFNNASLAAAGETFVTCARRADRWSVGRTVAQRSRINHAKRRCGARKRCMQHVGRTTSAAELFVINERAARCSPHTDASHQASWGVCSMPKRWRESYHEWEGAERKAWPNTRPDWEISFGARLFSLGRTAKEVLKRLWKVSTCCALLGTWKLIKKLGGPFGWEGSGFSCYGRLFNPL